MTQIYKDLYFFLDKTSEPVFNVTSGKEVNTVQDFKAFMGSKGGTICNISDGVCDMPTAFLSGAKDYLFISNVRSRLPCLPF
ncbi:hypothetical protein [Desulfopila sp. IMCC35008]|uniref:hypothetical protein n=1 Tax=Desulfopila sp. IMCC35008 TaxID=2653858 RepID=UPI0013D2602A|nr:hypothetical protein [Desulfopila sp. IMCC35008]